MLPIMSARKMVAQDFESNDGEKDYSRQGWILCIRIFFFLEQPSGKLGKRGKKEKRGEAKFLFKGNNI